MNDRMLARIARKAGVADLVDVLADRLSASELQSLLLAVLERRARAGDPADLARRYAENRFTRPSATSPVEFAAFDRLAYSLLPAGFEAVELSPVAPLGASSIVADVSQNRIVSTARNTEVAADLTNAMALECARRRQAARGAKPRRGRPDARVKLAASQRLVRAQPMTNAAQLPHFRLFGLCTAGRDEGAFRFELEALFENVDFYLRLLAALRDEGRRLGAVRVPVTALPDGPSEALLDAHVLAPLSVAHPDVRVHHEPGRRQGRGYYTGVCFHVYVEDARGEDWQLADGGGTTWTQRLSSDRKERLFISGFGTERVLGLP